MALKPQKEISITVSGITVTLPNPYFPPDPDMEQPEEIVKLEVTDQLDVEKYGKRMVYHPPPEGMRILKGRDKMRILYTGNDSYSSGACFVLKKAGLDFLEINYEKGHPDNEEVPRLLINQEGFTGNCRSFFGLEHIRWYASLHLRRKAQEEQRRKLEEQQRLAQSKT